MISSGSSLLGAVLLREGHGFELLFPDERIRGIVAERVMPRLIDVLGAQEPGGGSGGIPRDAEVLEGWSGGGVGDPLSLPWDEGMILFVPVVVEEPDEGGGPLCIGGFFLSGSCTKEEFRSIEGELEKLSISLRADWLEGRCSLLTRSIEFLNSVTFREFEEGGAARLYNYTFTRLRRLFDYDVCAVATCGADGAWKVVYRLHPSIGGRMLDEVRKMMTEALCTEFGAVPSSIRVEYVYEGGGGERDGTAVESSFMMPLVLPREGGGDVRGLIAFFSARRGFFTVSHVKLLAMLMPGLTSAVAGANFVDALNEHARELEHINESMEFHLELAERIQEALLPAGRPEASWLDSSAYLRTARRIGGDFWAWGGGDATGCVDVAIADVAGKGLSAALLMAFTMGALRQLWAEDLVGTPPGRLLSSLNSLLSEAIDLYRFVTMGAVRIEPSGRLLFSSAGHERVFVLGTDGAIERLGVPALPLGVISEVEYRTFERRLAPGDAVVMLTDGIGAPRRADGRIMDEDELYEVLERVAGEDARTIRVALVDRVAGFLEGGEPEDDMTCVVLVYRGEAGI